MPSKFERFDELPPELKIETAQHLPTPDLVKLAQLSKHHFAFFKPMLDVRKLLHHVTRGEYDEVKAMLEHDSSLIFKRGRVNDCSGREFENISAFEYALWALDKHMWAAMIACIPHNETTVFEKLNVQYDKVATNGITYKLKEKPITETHFDFENTIIKELQTQVNSIYDPGIKNWEAIDKQWREGVGGAQKLLPAHVVYEYCSDEPFYPIPKFIQQPKSSKQFFNGTTGAYENWFSDDSKLSIGFAIYKVTGARAVRVATRVEALCQDLDAMMALCKARTNDFINLKLQLDNHRTPDNHHHASRISTN